MSKPSLTKPISRTKTVSRGIDLKKLDQELQWRSWFPDSVVFDARNFIPDEEVDVLLAAFTKFCREALVIKVPGRRIPMILRDAQLATVRDWLQHRYTVALKARQIGFSTLSAAFALWVAIGGPDRQIYLLSKKEDSSVALLNKAKFMAKNLPEWVKVRAPSVIDKTLLRMSFDNDSFIISGPTASDPIRGETAFLVVCDEWASFPNQEEAWASVEPATDIGGRIIGLSTAKGEGDFFHRLFVGAQTGNNTFKPIFHPWNAVPDRDEAWYEDKARNMEPWQLYQEYPANPEEAFIGSGNPFFNLETLRDMEVREPSATYTIEAKKYGARYEEQPGGDFWVYEEPKRESTYVVGADIAQGLDHGDWSVAFVMEVSSGDIVAVYRGKVEPDYFASIIAGIGWKYGYALVCPEVNNHGRTTVDHLRLLGYSRIYRRRTKLKRTISALETIGWLTTHGNKPDILNELSIWTRTHNVPHGPTLAELMTFVREQRGERIRLHGSPHDDCVLALAITVEAKRWAIENHSFLRDEDKGEGSIEWWAKKLEKQNSKKRHRMSPVF